eukprot:7673617-Pyramimonas_sp.AAC.1
MELLMRSGRSGKKREDRSNKSRAIKEADMAPPRGSPSGRPVGAHSWSANQLLASPRPLAWQPSAARNWARNPCAALG